MKYVHIKLCMFYLYFEDEAHVSMAVLDNNNNDILIPYLLALLQYFTLKSKFRTTMWNLVIWVTK